MRTTVESLESDECVIRDREGTDERKEWERVYEKDCRHLLGTFPTAGFDKGKSSVTH